MMPDWLLLIIGIICMGFSAYIIGYMTGFKTGTEAGETWGYWKGKSHGSQQPCNIPEWEQASE